MRSVERVVVVAVAMQLTVFSLAAEEWSRFRGPNGSGVSSATGLPVEFGPEMNRAWSVDVPFGRSSPVLGESQIFLTAVDGGKLVTLAIDRASGALLWRRELERDYIADLYQGTDSASATPVTDGSNVYAFFHEAGLVSYGADGEQRWRLPLGRFNNFYGVAASPILAGDMLIVLCDQTRGSYLLAVDKNTGRERWRQSRAARQLSYTTPVLLPDALEPRQVVVFGTRWLDSYDLVSGKSLWAFNGVGVGPVASPVLTGEIVIVNAIDQAADPLPPFSELTKEHDADQDGRLGKSEVEETWMFNHFGWLDTDSDGRISTADWETLGAELASDTWGIQALRISGSDGGPEVLWNLRQSVPYIPSPLVFEGVLYAVKDGIVSAIDPQTGELLKRARLEDGSPKVFASPIAADGKVYIAIVDGRIAVLAGGPEWEVLAMNDLGDEIHATPAIGDKHLFVRTKRQMFSFAAVPESQTAGLTSDH